MEVRCIFSVDVGASLGDFDVVPHASWMEHTGDRSSGGRVNRSAKFDVSIMVLSIVVISVYYRDDRDLEGHHRRP